MLRDPSEHQDQARRFTRAMFEMFQNDALVYAVLRGYEGLPDQITHDIDLGVRVEDFTAMAKGIHRVAQATGCAVIRNRRKAGFRQLYVLCDATIVKLDIWCELTLRGDPYLDMNCLLQTRVCYNGLWVLPHDSEALLTALKEILHNRAISARKAAIALQKCPEPPVSVDLGCPEHCIRLVWDCLARPDDRAAGSAVRDAVLAASRPFDVARLWGKARFLALHVSDRLRKTGKFIVLLGPDGSGKTTLSQHLIDEIDNGLGLHSQHRYVHGRFGLLPNLGRIQGRSDRSRTMTVGYEGRKDADRVHSNSRVALYLGYYFWDYLLGYWLLIWSAHRDTLTIADRYFYDYFLQPMYRNYPQAAKQIYLWMLPRPEAIIFLKADPKAIVDRKPELTEEEIEDQQQKIEALLRHPTLKKRSTIVSTDSDQESTKAALRQQVYA